MNYYQQNNIKNLLERKLYYLIAIILTITISIGSLISIENVVKVSLVPSFDKFIHASAYFLLTLSWLLAFNKNLKQSKSNIFAIILVVVYGIVIEVLQGILTNNRQPELFDLLANLVGIISAYLFLTIIFQKKS